MPERPELPIDRMIYGDGKAKEFRKKHLSDCKYLNRKDLGEIEKVFGVGDRTTGRLNCDEAHAHRFECEEYYHPSTMIVRRLLLEIEKYQSRLGRIHGLSG